jgi:hypothetical protein
VTTKEITLRIGGRDVVLVAGASVEHWWEEQARRRLHAIAAEWPGRDALLRLSDETLGPSNDIDAAIEHLVRVLDRGDLVAVRVDEQSSTGIARASDADWDAPRLADLPGDRPRTRSDAPRPATRSTIETDPRSADPSSAPGSATERPTDTWSTFVAFVVVDQDGKPLAGESRCTISGTKHVHALGEAPIEIEPVAAHARVLLELAELAATGEATS